MFDVHCHLEYMDDPISVINEAKQKEVRLITSAADPNDAAKTLSFAENKGVFCSLGFHPERQTKYSFLQIRDYLDFIERNSNKIVAVGEVGLDYNWIKSSEGREKSRKIFEMFIELAKKKGLPLVIHSRNEPGSGQGITDALDILEGEKVNVILHCFSGNSTQLKKALDLGYWISYATIICKSDKHKRLVVETPIENILLETDSPWLDPFESGLVNRPWKIESSAEVIGQIKNMPKEKVLAVTEENAMKAFKIKDRF